MPPIPASNRATFRIPYGSVRAFSLRGSRRQAASASTASHGSSNPRRRAIDISVHSGANRTRMHSLVTDSVAAAADRHSGPVALIDHIDLRVANLEKIVKSCCDSLGCELERGPGEFRLAQLGAGQSLIDLVDAAGPIGPSAAASRSQSRKQATFRVEARPGRQNAVYSRPARRTSGR